MILAPAAMKKVEDDPKKASLACLEDIQFDVEKYRVGNTKARLSSKSSASNFTILNIIHNETLFTYILPKINI